MDKINNSHFTSWNTDSTLYLKCSDIYGNYPTTDRCSIKIQPIEDYNF
jgi:hypothetical protein